MVYNYSIFGFDNQLLLLLLSLDVITSLLPIVVGSFQLSIKINLFVFNVIAIVSCSFSLHGVSSPLSFSERLNLIERPPSHAQRI